MALEQSLRLVRPSHLPPQAVLVIRTLASRTAFGAGGDERLRWRQQLEGQLAEAGPARHCARTGSTSPRTPTACCLTTKSRLLACLTRDVLAGRWTGHWDELFPARQLKPPGSTWEPCRPVSRRLPAGGVARLSPSRTARPGSPAARRGGGRPEPPEPGGAVAAGVQPARYLCPAARRARRCRFRAERRSSSGAHSGSQPPQHLVPHGGGGFHPTTCADLAPPAEYLLGLCYTLAHRPQEARGKNLAGRLAAGWRDMTNALSAGRRRAPERALRMDATEAAASVQNDSGASRVDAAMDGSGCQRAGRGRYQPGAGPSAAPHCRPGRRPPVVHYPGDRHIHPLGRSYFLLT